MTRRTWVFLAAALLMVAALGSTGGPADAAFPDSAPSTSANAGVAQKETGKPDAINCADIDRLGINKQMNLRAAEIMKNCGRGKEVQPQSAAKGGNFAVSPDAYGGVDKNVHPSNSALIQSETFSWRQGNTIVVTYNDLSGGSTGKGSYSTDGGATFQRIPGDPFGAGHGSNFGDPTVVYDTVRNVWVVNFLAGGCGGQGIGSWRSADGIAWAAGGCVNISSQDDRNSAWSDTNPASPFHGRVYATWNDFNIGGGALRSSFSNDGGLTWSAAVTIVPSFIRDVQLTGLPDGTLVLAGMNEGGGGVNPRTNMFYRSTNGGATWTTVTANTFTPPGDVNCAGNSYFRVITPQIRHMGWGQPAGGPGGVVHYAYAAHGAGADEGDIFYIRSADSGLTWSAPLKLNTDATTRAQWMPSVAVTPGGAVFVQWYDRRDTIDNSYWRYGRASLDNGLTWQTDQTVSDAVIPQPIVQTANCYMGDYDYSHGHGTNISGAWTDSRGAGSGGTQDAFFDTIPLIQGTPSPTPTGTLPTNTPTLTHTRTPTITPTPCGAGASYSIATGTATIVAGTTNIGSFCDDCVVNVTIPFPFQLYDQTFTQVDLDSNGKAHFPTGGSVFTNTCLPGAGMTYTIFPYWDDQRTDTVGSGIFTSVSGTAPNRIFNIEWRTTYFSGAGTANYNLRLYEGLPGGNSRFDVIYGVVSQGITPATGGVQKSITSFTQAFCDGVGTPITPNNLHAYSAPVTCGPTLTPTRTPTGPTNTAVPPTITTTRTATRTNTAAVTVTGTQCAAAGLLIGNTITIGYAPNGYTALATNGVNYSFANSQVRPNQYAIFQTHDPWGSQVIEDAITGTGRTYTEFPFTSLPGFVFANYRVVILNFDDHFLTDFLTDYNTALPQLQAYVAGGGVLWVQGSIQGSAGDTYPMPFGGTAAHDFHASNDVVNNAHPLVAGVPDPFNGNFASHAEVSGLPAGATTIVVTGASVGAGAGAGAGAKNSARGAQPAGGKSDTPNVPTLYEYRPAGCPTNTPTITATATCPPFAGNIASARNPVVVDGGVKPKLPDQTGKTQPTRPNVAVVKGEPGLPAKLAPPAAPNVVLYDQYNNDGVNAIVSANRSDDPTLSAQAADDFVVPAGQSWSINQVDARGYPGIPAQGSVNVYFYADAGTLPGAPVYTALNLPYTGDPDLLITLTTPANLSSGSYWVSVEANMSLANWYWGMRSVQSNDPAAWREGGGYATGCNMPGWFNRGTCTGSTNLPDQMFRLNGTIGGGCPTNTPTGTPPTATVTATRTATACVAGYTTVATTGATIVPGTTDIGNHCDDCTTSVTFPFPITIYGTSYTSGVMSSNGNVQFTGNTNYLGTSCPLPDPNLGRAIMAYQDDLRTDEFGTPCSGGCGIRTLVTGTAPNRTYYIEWRTGYFGRAGNANFELVFLENSTTFSVIYGATVDNGAFEESGVQSSSTGPATQFSCLTATLTNGLRVDYVVGGCPTGTPATATTTATRTSTATHTRTPTVTATATCAPGGAGPWTPAAAVPVEIVRYAFAQTANDFYVISGVTTGGLISTGVYRYNVGTGAWSTLASIPIGSEGPAAAYFNNRIYVIPGNGQTAFQIYDIPSNAWSTGPAFPGTGYGSAAGAFNGNVYAVGGLTDTNTQTWIYNIAANSWSAGPAAPTGFLLGGYQQVGQYIYMVGSYGAAPLGIAGGSLKAGNPNKALVPSANSTSTKRLDMSTNTYSTGPVWTQGRADFGLAYDPGTNKLYAMGGDTTGGGFFDFSPLVDELSLAAWPAGTWTASLPNLPSGRQANQAGFYGGGSIWSTGAYTGAFGNEHLRRTNTGNVCPTGTPPTATRTATATNTPCPVGNYTTAVTTGATIVPGTTDIGNHCDDCYTGITLPFAYTLYDQTYTTAQVGSNGNIIFGTGSLGFTNSCLPAAATTYLVLPHWDDLYTFDTAAGQGIFSSVSGTAPNRIFNLEWRTEFCCNAGPPVVNFEVRLYEGQTIFDVIYGTPMSGNGLSATSGVQKDATTFAQYSCNTATLTSGTKVTYTLGAGGCPTGTPGTATATPTCVPGGGVTNALIVFSDGGVPPSALIAAMQAEGITTVNTFDAQSSTPTLAQLQAAQLVVAYSNNPYADPVALGNVLADYADTGGIVVGLNFNWYGAPFGLAGRWMTGGYSPYNDNAPTLFSTSNANITNPSHPLMLGVTTLTAFFRHSVTLSTGAVSVADWLDLPSAVAYKTNNGRTGVAINAYLGEQPMNYSGQFGKVIANAGRWLAGVGCPTPTVTPTACPRTLNGHLTYQGMPQPNAFNVQAITLQLQPTGGGAVSTYNTTTDLNGNFTVNVGPLAAGTYNWWLKSPRYLASTGSLTIPAGCAPFSHEFGTQRAGDVDNTNLVDIVDFSLLRASFGRVCGDPLYNPNTEYSGDCLVDITDFSLLRGNFGQLGPAPLALPAETKPGVRP